MFVSSGAGLEERSLNVDCEIAKGFRVFRPAVVLLCLSAGATSAGAQQALQPVATSLPEAPSALLADAAQSSGKIPRQTRAATPDPCANPPLPPGGTLPLQGPPPLCEKNPIQPIVTLRAKELSSNEKGVLAIRNFVDPFNLLTIAGYSAVVVASNAHTAYGSGFAGFGKLTGYGLAQDAQGEFFETYAIPSVVHEDPRYHRMPGRPFKLRLGHAIAHTFVARRDDGRYMPNYATLLTYPISAELSNLYVPGVQKDAASTTRRIAIGLATDPAGSIVAEFLPDVARRIHIHIVFVQEILNAMVVGAPATQLATE